MDLMAIFPREHRVKGFLFDYPSSVLALVVLYIAVVMKFGPEFMRKRKPYDLRGITRVYNLAQVAANVWFCYQAIALVWRYRAMNRFKLFCNPPTTQQRDLEFPGDTEHLIFFSTMYLYVRAADLFDTILFILSKKLSHVTFLHVYHHVMVVTSVYVYLRSGWAISVYYVGVINAMVHVIMYTYYFLSTFPAMKPYLWWKRYLTVIQIVQFIVAGFYFVTLSIWNCGFPPIVLQYNVSQAIIFLTLFSQFYVKRYIQNSSPKVDRVRPVGCSKVTEAVPALREQRA